MRKKTGKQGSKGLLQRAAASLANALTRKSTKTKSPMATKAAGDGNGSTPKQTRRPKRESDIPMNRIDEAYTPQTSLKSGFRGNGADRASDQEFAGGFSDERWKDEDRLTNKSGDPRIGTHNRTYEPGEKE